MNSENLKMSSNEYCLQLSGEKIFRIENPVGSFRQIFSKYVTAQVCFNMFLDELIVSWYAQILNCVVRIIDSSISDLARQQ